MSDRKPLTLEQRLQLMDANAPEVDFVHSCKTYFDWSWTGCGFGQLSINYDEQTGEFTAMNECMGRESVRKFLHALADYVADRVVLIDEVQTDAGPLIDSRAELDEHCRTRATRRTVRRVGTSNE